jgi:transcriptional regulator with XRE-family HTH domain
MPTTMPLAERLKVLRAQSTLTQPLLAKALGVSVPLISSWENGRSLPPRARIEEYSRLFSALTGVGEAPPRLPALAQLTAEQRAAYEDLRSELMELRGNPLPRVASDGVVSPWQFPPGQAITIVCSKLPEDYQKAFPYSDPAKPDFTESYRYADIDALLTLLGHVSHLNPLSPVKFGIPADLTGDDRTAHLILLGGIDFNELTADLLRELSHVPVKQLARETDDDRGGFEAGTRDGRRRFEPRLIGQRDQQVLKEDVALFLRTSNPFNRERTATLCNGLFARGTLGVVKALIEPKIRERNLAYLAERFAGEKTYSILCRVKVVANEIVVPDWRLDDIRLHEWPEA